jgi:hypothetical protein
MVGCTHGTSAVSVTDVGVIPCDPCHRKESSSLCVGGLRTDSRPKAITTISVGRISPLSLSSRLPPRPFIVYAVSFALIFRTQRPPCAPFLRLPSPQDPCPAFPSRFFLDLLVPACPLTILSNVHSRPHKRYQDLSCVLPINHPPPHSRQRRRSAAASAPPSLFLSSRMPLSCNVAICVLPICSARLFYSR